MYSRTFSVFSVASLRLTTLVPRPSGSAPATPPAEFAAPRAAKPAGLLLMVTNIVTARPSLRRPSPPARRKHAAAGSLPKSKVVSGPGLRSPQGAVTSSAGAAASSPSRRSPRPLRSLSAAKRARPRVAPHNQSARFSEVTRRADPRNHRAGVGQLRHPRPSRATARRPFEARHPGFWR